MKTEMYRLYFDLRDVEETSDAYFGLRITDEDASFLGHPFPPGLIISSSRRFHGADVHLTWPQVRELRDALTVLLREHGQQ